MATVKKDTEEAKEFHGLPFMMGRQGVTVAPIEKEDTGQDITTWGANNLYPQWINGLFYQSAVHQGIIRSKVFFTVSGGLNYEGADQVGWERMFDNGTSDVNLDQLMGQMSLDVELSDMMVLRGRWSMDRSHCSRLDLVPYETVRKQLEGNDIYVCPDWSDKENGLVVYRPLNLDDRERLQFYVMFETKPKQMLIDGQRKVESGVYPLVPYIGGIKSIQTDIEIVNYQHSEIINGFALGTIVNLNNGAPKTPGDRKKFERRIEEASGSDSANGTIVLFNNGKDNAVTVEHLSGNDLHLRYIALSDSNKKNLLTAHSVTSTTLFGLEMGGNFNASEMEVGYEIMKANYFKVRQNQILSLIRLIATDCNGLEGEITFNDVPLVPEVEAEVEDEVIEALSKMSKAMRKKVIAAMTDEEARAFAKLPAKPEKLKQAAEDKIGDEIILQMSKVGKPKAKALVLSSCELDVNDIQGSGQKFLEEFQKDHFAIENAILSNILSLIADDNDFDNIAAALDMKPSDLAISYGELTEGGYLNDKGIITTKGILEVATENASRLSIVYSYEVRPELAQPDVIPTTRDFCRKLIQLDRVYTREEIDTISTLGSVSRNVWLFRGGWYHNPDTDITTPFCRHFWQQNIVFI